MFKKFFTVFLLAFLFGQTQSQKQILKSQSETLISKSRAEKKIAVEKANQKRWPIKGKLENGEEYSIQRLAPNGKPIYYHSENFISAKTISTDHLWPDGDSQLFMKGEGMIVGEWDGGATRATHDELTGRVVQVDGAEELSNHATHVAGTMIGAGIYNLAHGMANAATLHTNDWNEDSGEMAAQAGDGLILSNHSYGQRGGWHWNSLGDDKWVWWGDPDVDVNEDYHFGFYDEQTREWDEIAYNAPHYLIVMSAGNDRNDEVANGTEHWVWNTVINDWDLSTDSRDPDGPWDCISYHKICKNVLTVGAVNDIENGYENPGDVSISSFSSYGPVDDGRIKPDIVANGVGLFSSVSTGDQDYESYSGTSMSAPSVTGSLVLFQEMYKTMNDTFLLAATLKALAVHSADEAGNAGGPDYRFGWGLMNTARAVDLIQRNGNGHLISEEYLAPGDSIELSVYSDGMVPLRATISWTDPPGIPPLPSLNPQDIMLVNDLDLRIIGEDGTIYFPWILDPNNPGDAATTGDNIVDNVEQVLIFDPEPGNYTIRIWHKGNIDDGQAFGLVLSFGTSGPMTFYVSPEGNDDTGDGSEENPFSSIQKAVDESISRDTILVAPGTYNGSIEINSKGIILASHFIHSDDETYIAGTVLTNNEPNPILYLHQTGTAMVVKGFTFSFGALYGDNSIECTSGNITIENCVFTQTGSDSDCGAISFGSSHGIINNSRIENMSGCFFGALYVYNSNVELDHFSIINTNGSSHIIYSQDSQIDMNFVTLSGNSVDEDYSIIRMYDGSELNVINSILWNEGATEIAFRVQGEENFATIYYTDLNGHINGIETNDNGTTNFGLFNVMETDPLFCAPDSNDFQLSGNSPCADYSENGGPIGAFGIGCDFVGIGDQASVSGEFQLFPAYPNPFNPSTTIRFNVGVETLHATSLQIFDITGRVVETLVDGVIDPGEHEVVWDASGFSSGVYFAKFVSGKNRQIQKMILLK